METYLTVLSSNIFETINPFWAAVDRGLVRPSAVRIFYVPEYKKWVQKAAEWFREISSQYLRTDDMTIESQLFDDENIQEFSGGIKQRAFHRAV